MVVSRREPQALGSVQTDLGSLADWWLWDFRGVAGTTCPAFSPPQSEGSAGKRHMGRGRGRMRLS